jgi:CTP synthase (UTP-ammonia lyase)
VKILALGDRDPAFFTHRELDATFGLMPAGVECSWTATDSREARELESADGVWLLPGTPYRDDAAAYAAIAHCRRSGTPFLGTCGGFQYACVDLARALAGIAGAAHAESADAGAGELVVVPLRCSLYGERRLVEPVPGTRLAQSCGDQPFTGFHWCGYGLDPRVEARLAAAGVVLSARAEDAGVEAIELPDHPFFVATAFQPQVGSGESGLLHPLITALLTAAAHRHGTEVRR